MFCKTSLGKVISHDIEGIRETIAPQVSASGSIETPSQIVWTRNYLLFYDLLQQPNRIFEDSMLLYTLIL